MSRAAWISTAESASIHWIAWFAAIGLPNCCRRLLCSIASSRRCWLDPTAPAERHAADVESSESSAKSRADLASEHIRLRHLAVFEDELAGVRPAKPHLVVDLPDAETLEDLLHDEAGDTAARAFRAIVRGVDDHDVCDRTVCHPDLRAVQDPAAVTQRRARLDRSRIGSARGLRQRERRDLLSGGEVREVPALLVLGAAEKDRHRANRGVRADDVRERGRRAPELFEREAIPEIPRADAAVLLGERKPEETELTHLLENAVRDLVGLFDL